MSSNFQLSKKDFKTRKLWLRVNFFCSIIYPLLVAMGLLVLSGEGSFGSRLLTLTPTLVLCLVGLAIPFYILYRCAYDKPGTRLLTWVLFLSPLGLIYDLSAIYKEGGEMGGDAWMHLAIKMIVFIGTFILNLRLRKINTLLQLQEGYSSPEFHQELMRMKNTFSLEVLDYAYHKILEKWPQWKPISSYEYEKKKKEL